MPSRFVPIAPGTDESQQIALINRNFAELDNEGVNKIYNGSDGVPRIFINGATGVIKVAPEGVDVTTATDAQLNFNSAQNVLKIVDSGVVTVPAKTVASGASGSSSVNIPHNASVAVPIVLAFGANGAPNDLWQGEIYSGGSYAGATITHTVRIRYYSQYVDDDNSVIGFQIDNAATGSNATAGPYTVRYYILQESAN